MHKDTASVSKNLYNKEYSYMTMHNGNTTDKVSKITYTGTYNKTFRYGYDGCGNISEINDMWYLYDEAGQLTTEVNINTNTGKDYVYDKGGNITEVRHFENGEYGATDTYTYGNSNWKDLLTEYNGNKITYDEIGNPLTYYNGMEFSWTMGRRLESVTNGKSKTRYTYNADGLRTSKKINAAKFNYYWNGDKLTAQTWQGNTLYFYYDKDGNPIAFEYNDVFYYYITNLQGDIVGILRSDGIIVAEYEYDAWGNCTIIQNLNNIANTNPLRYRGYYYDTDTGLYYLQSRYYDSNIGRFINADDLNVITSPEGFEKKVLGINLFSYGNNSPILNKDYYGYFTGVEESYVLIICILACVNAITATLPKTSGSFSGGISWGGNTPATTNVRIENTKLLTVAANTKVTVRTKAKSVATSLTKSANKAKIKVKKAEYMLATEVYYGSNKRGATRNYVPTIKISKNTAVKVLKAKGSIFTRYSIWAKGVAQLAGNGKTEHHIAKKAGYFSHYHAMKTVKKNGKSKSVKMNGHAFYTGG